MTEEMGREIAKIRNRLIELAEACRDEGKEPNIADIQDIASAKKLKWAVSILKGLAVND